MKAKKLEMMFRCSDPMNRTFLDLSIDDERNFNNCSKSRQIENILLDHYLTQSDTLNRYIRILYLNDEENNSTGNCLSVIFRDNIAGLYELENILPDKDYKALIKFCYETSRLCRFAPLEITDEIFHCSIQLDSTVQYLEKVYKNLEEDLKPPLGGHITLLKEQLKVAEENPRLLNFAILFNSIYECWELLKKLPTTFKLLMNLCLLEKRWSNVSNSHYQLLMLIKSFASRKSNSPAELAMDGLFKLRLEIEDDEEISELEELELIKNYLDDYAEKSHYEELYANI